MSQTLTQINTPLTGAAGTLPNEVPGAGGGAGGDAAETFSNDAFAAQSSGEIALTPRATGGAGALADAGAIGTAGTTTTIGQTTFWSAGGDGQPGGAGGDGGAASITLSDISVGSSAQPSTTGVEIDAVATGDSAGGGGGGGSGGTGGYNATGVVGAQGGNGANGGAGGIGGSATVAVSGFVSYDSGSVGTDLFSSAQGGAGGTGFAAAAGAEGGSPSNGGLGGAGGAGGGAADSFTGATVVDNTAIYLQSTAIGNQGQLGGNGGQAGPELTIANTGTYFYTYGVNGDAGNGGAGGNASVTLANNTLTAPVVNLFGTVDAGFGGAGGTSPSEASGSGFLQQTVGSPSGAAGAAGAQGVGQIVFTGNTITVGQGLNGSIPFNQPGHLNLSLEVLNLGSINNNVVQNLNGAAGGNLQFSGNSFVGQGNSTLNLGLAGTGSVVIDTAADTISIAGSPANAITGFATLDLDTNNTVIAGAGPLTLNFASDPDTLIFTPTSGSVTVNLATTSNMVLEFQGFGAALTPTTLQNDTTVSAGDTFINIGGGQIELTGFTSAIPSGDEIIQCFRAGTRIATPDGMVAVEALAVGDPVALHDGGSLPVRWIGRRAFDCRTHPRPDTVSPIRIMAHAFAANEPVCDLYLSPEHAIYVENVLIPVRHLVNHDSIARVAAAVVTWYHVALPRHAVILAEGLPVESYLDTGETGFFTAGGVSGRSPAAIWETDGAAPLCVSGPAVERARARLAARRLAFA